MTTKTVAILMKRLLEIDKFCCPDRAQYQQEEAAANADKFTQRRRQLGSLIKEIRVDIEERDKNKSTYAPADLAARSANIRQKIQDARLMGDDLEKIHKKKKEKLALKADAKEEKRKASQVREEVISTMHRHFDELERLASALGANVSDSDSGNEYSDGQAIPIAMLPTQTKLTDLGSKDFDQIMINEQVLDAELDELHGHVRRLKVLAIQAGEEISKSEEQIERLQILAETTTSELQAANRMLSKVLAEVKSPNAFCCDCILCLMVVGIAIGMYFALTN